MSLTCYWFLLLKLSGRLLWNLVTCWYATYPLTSKSAALRDFSHGETQELWQLCHFALWTDWVYIKGELMLGYSNHRIGGSNSSSLGWMSNAGHPWSGGDPGKGWCWEHLGARVGPILLPTFANLINGENTKAVEQEGRSEWRFYIQLQTIIEA